MSIEPSDFDIQAALLRQGDQPQELLAYLSTKMASALPELTRVERSGFLGRGTVRKVEINLGNSRYALELQRGGLVAQRIKLVRGVEIAHEELQVPAWIAQLTTDLRNQAAQSETIARALRGLIFD